MPQVDNPSVADKVALVTGASRGIGRAIAQRLASAGASVAVTARSVEQSVAEPGTLAETVELIEKNGGRAVALGAEMGIRACADHPIVIRRRGPGEAADDADLPQPAGCIRRFNRHGRTGPAPAR